VILEFTLGEWGEVSRKNGGRLCSVGGVSGGRGAIAAPARAWDTWLIQRLTRLAHKALVEGNGEPRQGLMDHQGPCESH
jgi:hypothetical protein